MIRALVRLVIPLTAALALAGCGGGGAGSGSASGGGGGTHALGEEVVVRHTQISGGGANPPATRLGIAVLRVRKGTQQDLKAAGFEVDEKNRTDTPYYVDVRYRNAGSQAIAKNLDVSLEDENDDLITSTVIFNFGNVVFKKCPQVSKGQLAPSATYESCTLFLVDKDREPKKVSFLPNTPGKASDFVYWAVA